VRRRGDHARYMRGIDEAGERASVKLAELREARAKGELVDAHARYRRQAAEAVAAGGDPAIGSMVQDRPDICDNCRKLAWVGCFDWNAWTCYGCGLRNLRPAGVARPALEDA
jgi:hypothetical protein